MGWSCACAAAVTMRKWENACHRSTGSSNTWEENGAEYFFEPSRTEHADGAITGSIYRSNGSMCRRSASFRINGDGTIKSAPAFLKNA